MWYSIYAYQLCAIHSAITTFITLPPCSKLTKVPTRRAQINEHKDNELWYLTFKNGLIDSIYE